MLTNENYFGPFSGTRVSSAVGFRRDDYYRVSEQLNAVDDVSILAVVGNESYLRRLATYGVTALRLRRSLSDVDVVVVFSSEHALLATLVTSLGRRRPRILRELADIPRAVDGSDARAAIASRVEALGLRASAALVVTSTAYADRYARSRMGYTGPILTLVNKPDLLAGSNGALPLPHSSGDGPLTIVYPGLIRCARSLAILRHLTQCAPEQFKVIVRGYELSISSRAPETSLCFCGPFQSPDDLPSVYRSADIVYSGYPYEPSRMNYSTARTNRFYEAVHFGRPQIAHSGTLDGIIVEENEIGIAIDPHDPVEAAQQVLDVSPDRWSQYARNAQRLASTWSTYDDDFVDMLNQLPVLL